MRLVALDGVADRPLQTGGIQLILQQVVLRVTTDRLQRRRRIGMTRQYYDGDPGGHFAHGTYDLDALTVGEPEIEEDEVRRVLGHRLAGGSKGCDADEFDPTVGIPVDVLSHQIHVARVVLDQEDSDPLVAHSHITASRRARGGRRTRPCIGGQ